MWNLSYDTISQALKVSTDCRTWNTPEWFLMSPQLFYILESFYILCLALCKVSVVFFCLRIFPSHTFRIAAYCVMALIMLPAIILIFLQIFQCHPIHWVWHGWRLPYYRDRCMDIHTITFVAAGFSIFQDVLVLVLPLPSLVNLNMGTRSKWGVIIMFSLGAFVTITSCIRLRYITLFGRSSNPTWEYPEVLNWTGIELSVAIIVACLPAMWVLIKRIVPWIATTVSGSYNKERTNASKSTLQAKGASESQNRGYFKKSRDRNTESQTELGFEMELGDRSNGAVQTLVSKDRSHDEYQPKSGLETSKEGIFVVKTVTTTSRSLQ